MSYVHNLLIVKAFSRREFGPDATSERVAAHEIFIEQFGWGRLSELRQSLVGMREGTAEAIPSPWSIAPGT